LADVTDITVEETAKILEKLSDKGWLKVNTERQTISLTNLKQLNQLGAKR
jgi:helix-turn-helix protein